MGEIHVLEHGSFFFEFGEFPGLIRMGDRNTGAVLSGNSGDKKNEWFFYRTGGSEYTVMSDTSENVSYTRACSKCSVTWRVVISSEKKKVISAEVVALIENGRLVFRLEVLHEDADLQLAMFRLNGLSAASQTDPNSRLALPIHGGRLINPAICGDGTTDHRYNWILDSLGSCAVVTSRKISSIVRVASMDDQLTSTVGGLNGERYAQVGALLRYRYTIIDPSYRRAAGNDLLNVIEKGNPEYPIEDSFIIPGPPTVSISLVSHEALLPENAWTVGARSVCSSLSGKRSNCYGDHMVYKTFGGAPGRPVSTTFRQMADIIKSVHDRTGGTGQIVYIVGFQHQGHDSGYPDIFQLNSALGSREELEELVKYAESLNAVVSFHDNFDDAYVDSPAFCPDDISRDNSGHLLRGGVWNGNQAYWNSMPFYARNRSRQRIEKTLETYPFLKKTYHLDVLTASVFRIDFRKGAPAGKQQDLAARQEIVDQFCSKGLDISSEACGLPFIGSISYFWHMQRVPRPLYQGDTRIPMVPFLVHGKADYAGSHTTHPSDILDGLLYGAFYSCDINADTPIKELTDAYFMLQAPLNALRDDFAVAYEDVNGWKTIRYSSGAMISVQFESLECIVDIDGRRWIENGTAMIPQHDGSTLLYSAWEEPYSPVKWKCEVKRGTKLEAKIIGEKGASITLEADEEGVPLMLQPGVTYRVTL